MSWECEPPQCVTGVAAFCVLLAGGRMLVEEGRVLGGPCGLRPLHGQESTPHAHVGLCACLAAYRLAGLWPCACLAAYRLDCGLVLTKQAPTDHVCAHVLGLCSLATTSCAAVMGTPAQCAHARAGLWASGVPRALLHGVNCLHWLQRLPASSVRRLRTAWFLQQRHCGWAIGSLTAVYSDGLVHTAAALRWGG